jgi:hypothetical protein
VQLAGRPAPTALDDLFRGISSTRQLATQAWNAIACSYLMHSALRLEQACRTADRVSKETTCGIHPGPW